MCDQRAAQLCAQSWAPRCRREGHVLDPIARTAVSTLPVLDGHHTRKTKRGSLTRTAEGQGEQRDSLRSSEGPSRGNERVSAWLPEGRARGKEGDTQQ